MSELEGHFDRLLKLREYLPPDSVLFSCGDDGLTGSRKCISELAETAPELTFRFISVGGNHDNTSWMLEHPRIREGPLHDLAAGKVLYCERGALLGGGGAYLLCFGGGASSDTEIRLRNQQHGGERQYWPDELPGFEDYKRCSSSLAILTEMRSENAFLLTHTGAGCDIAEIRQLGLLRKSIPPEEGIIHSYLQTAEKTVRFRQHYFGHFHCDTVLSSARALRNDVCRLAGGSVICRLNEA